MVCSLAVSRCRRRRKVTDTSGICKYAMQPQMRRDTPPPLCKGRRHGVCRDAGSSRCDFQNNSSVASAPAPLTQGSLRCGGTVRRQKPLLNHLVCRWFSGYQKLKRPRGVFFANQKYFFRRFLYISASAPAISLARRLRVSQTGNSVP